MRNRITIARLFALLCLLFALPNSGVQAQNNSLPSLTAGETVSGILSSNQPTQTWSFDGAAGEIIRLSAQRLAGQFSPRLRLLDANGTLLAENQNFAFVDSDSLVLRAGLPATGLYRVEIAARAPLFDSIDNPNEYGLSFERLAMRRADFSSEFPAFVTADTLPDLLATSFIAAGSNPLNLTLYNGTDPVRQPDSGDLRSVFTITDVSGGRAITIGNVRPLSQAVTALSFRDDGMGFISQTNATFFTDQSQMTLVHEPDGVITIAIGGQTIVTDFYNIASIQALQSWVIVRFTNGQRLILNGTNFDLRRRARQPASEEPVFEIRLDNGAFINTDLAGWQAIAYRDNRLTLYYDQDARLVTDLIRLDVFQNNVNPAFADIALYDLVDSALALTSTFNIDWSGAALGESANALPMGQVALTENSLQIQTLDNRVINENFAFNINQRAVTNTLVEAGAVRFQRADGSFRLVLPDSTDIQTPLTPLNIPTALPHEQGFVPRGFNNLGVDSVYPGALNPLRDNLPVNPFNGNFFYAVQDFYIPSHTLELRLERFYNTQADVLTPNYMLASASPAYHLGQMGHGWRHSYQFELDIAQAPHGQVTLILPQGTRHHFNAVQGTNAFQSTTLPSWTLERFGGLTGHWRAATTDGLTYSFDRAGRLERIQDSNSLALSFAPIPRDYLRDGLTGGVFIVEPYGRRLELYTDDSGHVARARDTVSREIVYIYEGDLLVAVRYPDPAQTAAYSYENNVLSAFNDARSPYHPTGILAYNNRRVVTYTENFDGQQPRLFRYTYEPNLTRRAFIVSGAERSDTWSYDENFLFTGYTAPRPEFTYLYRYDRDSQLLAELQRPELTVFRFTHNAQGLLTSLRDPIYTGQGSYDYVYATRGARLLLEQIDYPNGGRETFVYDDTPAARLIEHRQLISRQPVQEHIRRFVYDDWGRVVSMIAPGPDGIELTTAYRYDSFGYIAGVQIGDWQMGFTHDILGRLRAIVDGDGQIYTLDWSSTHDGLRAIHGPEGLSISYEYDARGNVVRIEDRGSVDVYTYNDSDQLVTTTDALGRVTTYTYDEAGNLLSAVDPGGRATTYAYDALDNLTRVTTPTGAVWEFSFELEASDFTFRRVVDPSGRASVYRYDSLGRLRRVAFIDNDQQQVYDIRYSLEGNRADISYEFTGRTLSAEYNLIGQITATTIEDLRTQYSYDPAGNLSAVTDAAGLTTSYTHDVFGNITAVLLPNGGQTTYQYDGRHNLVTRTDALGQQTSYTYDGLNRRISRINPGGQTTSYRYDLRGNLLEVTDPRGSTRRATYDALDRLTAQVDALGIETRYEYDTFGRLVRMTAPLGLTTEYAYDLADNLVAMTQPAGRQFLYDYDEIGRLNSVTDALGHTYLYDYNSIGQLSSITNPLGNTQQYIWRNGRPGRFIDASGHSYEYNTDSISGRVATIRDTTSGGLNLQFEYDRAGRLLYMGAGTDRLLANNAAPPFSNNRETMYVFGYTQGQLTSYTDPSGGIWTLGYDSAGRVTSAQNPQGIVTLYVYDSLNRITQITHAAGTQSETSERFAYDANGNVIGHTASDGVVTAYAYDANNRLTEIRQAVGTNAERVYTYAYDEIGNLILLTDPNGTQTTYRYDLFGNLTRVIRTLDGQEIAYEYIYDLMGNLTGVVLPEGQRISMGYDALNQRVRYVDAAGGVWAYTYNSVNQLAQVSDPLGNVTRYEYDAFGRLTRIIYPNSAASTITYDQRGQFDSVYSPVVGADTTAARTSYQFDPAGNLLAIVDNADAQDASSTRFTYDALGNLINRTTPLDETTQYRYDEQGRLVEIIYPDDSRLTRAYDSADRLISITSPAGTIAFSYDPLGRLTAVTTGSTSIRYTYDPADNVLSRDAGALGAVLYTYDDLYRPVRIEYGGESIDLVYNLNGWRTGIMRSRGPATTTTYEANGRAEVVTHLFAGDQPLDQFNYSYDAAGSLTRISRRDNWTMLFSFNAAQQLIDERWLNDQNNARYTLNLRYDAAGNIVEDARDSTRTLYIYNENNQLIGEVRNYNPNQETSTAWMPFVGVLAVVAYARCKHWRRWLWVSPLFMALLLVPRLQQRGNELPPFDVAYVYRADGALQQIAYTATQNTLDFTYDADSRLISITGTREDGLPISMQFTYDALGRLVIWQDATTGYRLHYDGETVIARENVASGEIERYFAPFADQPLLTLTADGGAVWALQDASAFARSAFSMDTGFVPNTLDLNAFGQIINPYAQEAVTENASLPQQILPFGIYESSSQLYITANGAYDPRLARLTVPNPARHNPTIHLYGSGAPFTHVPALSVHPPYAEHFVGTFASLILDTIRPQVEAAPLLTYGENSPTTAQLHAAENFRIWQIIDTLGITSPVASPYVSALLAPLPTVSSGLSIPSAQFAHYTPDMGWVPTPETDPLAPPDPLRVLQQASAWINQPLAAPIQRNAFTFTLPTPQNPAQNTLPPELALNDLLPEVQIMTALQSEIAALTNPLPQVAVPQPLHIDPPIPVPQLMPPALIELAALYRPPLSADRALFEPTWPQIGN
ncbi:MAG: hypothetical protein HXY40_06770 [Chloroflexi bacterium]|nr:hypothetical protein [Chloroflexota bacterium]